MRFTLRFLGFEVLAISTDSEDFEDEGCSLDGGTTAAYPIGFTLRAGEELGVRPEWPYDE